MYGPPSTLHVSKWSVDPISLFEASSTAECLSHWHTYCSWSSNCTMPDPDMFTSLLLGFWVKSEVFGHESESSLKSFNGSLKNPIQNPHVLKSSYLWSCLIGYRQNIWYMICFVKKKKKKRGIKGIVLPKMKILSSFILPQVFPKPVWISLFCWTQSKIFWHHWLP